MTIEQAIENRKRCYSYLTGLGAKATPESVEAVMLSLEALREKAERDDPKPLTIDELKEMNGQPVWLWNKSQKPTCVICIFDQFRTEPVFLNYDFVKEDSTNITKYDRIRKWGYKFYRHKPKEA